MAGQTLLWDSRIRTAAVMLPALGLMMWIGSEIASEEFMIPAAILGTFSVLVLFTVFLTTIRFEAAILCALMVGYLVGNRGFADLAIVKPLYPGELGLGLITICLVCRFALSREIPDFSGWFARVIFVYCALGMVRLALDYKTYGLDAIRDSAMVYYAVFFFMGRQLASQPQSKKMLEWCLGLSFLALMPIAIISRFAPDLLLSGGGFSPLYQKDDLLTTFSAVAVYIIYTRPKIYFFKWLRVALILFYIVYVVSGIGRASLAALAAGSILIFVAGRWKFFLYPAAALVLGLTVLTGFAVSFGRSNTSDPMVLVEKVTSMLDVTGAENYHSDYGDQKAGTNDFRRKLWATFVDETNAVAPWFGRGFGYDFVVTFEETYRLSGPGALRSAHNFYVTLYGRMGWAGIVVFAVLTTQIIAGGIGAALRVKAGEEQLADLGYWIGTWVVLVSSIVGVVLEGPVGAIVFWVFLGVAVQASQAARLAARSQSAKTWAEDYESVAALPQRRSLSYGAARIPAVPSR